MKGALRMVCEGPSSDVDLLQRTNVEADLLALLQAKLSGKSPHLRRALLEPARYVLARPGKAFRGRLIRLAYQLAGGAGEPPPNLAFLVELLHTGSLVIDDVEDGSRERRGAPALHCVFGQAIAINTANWLYFWAQELLEQLASAPAVELEMSRHFARTMQRAHCGQALDLDAKVTLLAQAEVAAVAHAITADKTGALMSFAARLGALSAGAEPARVEALSSFGLALGTGLQRLDDWGGVSSSRMRDKGIEDLRHARVTWPWALLSEELEPARYAGLQEKLQRARDDAALDEVRSELARSLRELDAPAQARRALSLSLSRLAEELRLSEHALNQVADEIARLEVSYG